MMVSFSRSLLCPVLIGRAPYLDALAQAIEQARLGSGQTLLLAGEAGIGKSRLVSEARTLAVQSGFRLLQGACFESDRVLPYAPLLDLIRAFIESASADEALARLSPFAPELIKLLPELSRLLPGTVPTPPLDPEPEKRRLFQTLAEFLSSIWGERPVLIVIEDLHWGDDTSLEFLLYFSRRVASQSVALLLTYRNDELTPPLQHLLAELERGRLAAELALARLAADDVAAMIRAIFEQPTPVRAEFAEAIFSLTDGNPFFVEEILKSLVAAGDIYVGVSGWTRKSVGELHIPRTLQEAVQRRTDQLSTASREVLAFAAAAGRRFDFALLQHVTRLSEAELLKLIKELIAAQLVVEESADHFSFRHALTQQAIYTGLLARERRSLHRQIAETLESLYRDSRVAELALHSYEAGLWEKALAYSRQAGERAQALYTPRAAVAHYTRAIEAARNLPGSQPIALYSLRGEQYQTLGDFEAAQADYQAALAEARARPDSQAEWQALIDLGFLWAARDYTQTGEYFQQALALAHHLDNSAALAHNLNRVGNWHLNLDQSREALRYHHEALRIFEALGDRRGLASTHDLLGITYYASNDVHNGIAHYEQAMPLFRELEDWGGLASSLVIYASRGGDYIVSTAVPMRVTLTERLRAAEEALTLARATEAKPAETLTTLWLGMNLAASGDYGGFLQIRRGLELAEAINHQHFCVVGNMILGMCYLDVLAPALAGEALERALELARATHSGIWMGTVTAYLSLAYTHLGDLAQAETTLRAMLDPDTLMETMGQCQMWAAWAELQLAQGKPEAALQTVERLITASPNLEREGEHSNPRLSRLRGESLIALRRYATAEKVLRGALESARALELKPQQWRAWASLSRLHRAQGKPGLAEEAALNAGRVVDELAVTIPDPDIANRFRTGAAAQWAGRVTASPRQAAKGQFGGLTTREREVAALIARGKSNLEIAESLSLSHRTVEAHISNILSKLSFNSRAQIAVWAVEKGLV